MKFLLSGRLFWYSMPSSRSTSLPEGRGERTSFLIFRNWSSSIRFCFTSRFMQTFCALRGFITFYLRYFLFVVLRHGVPPARIFSRRRDHVSYITFSFFNSSICSPGIPAHIEKHLFRVLAELRGIPVNLDRRFAEVYRVPYNFDEPANVDFAI